MSEDLQIKLEAALAENAAYYQLAKKEIWEAADKEITTLKSALREAKKYVPKEQKHAHSIINAALGSE